MKKAKFRRELALLSIPVGLLAAVALHYQKLTAVSGRLVGTWKTGNAVAPYALTTFKSNGEWEQTGFDGSGNSMGLWKGRYADSGDTFRSYDIRRYSRFRGVDTLISACINGNEIECSTNHEADDYMVEISKPKYLSTILSADWKAGIMKVHSPGFGQYKGTISAWTRQP